MSKMSDMAMTIEELRSAAAAINEAASWLAEQFSGTADKAPAKEPAAKEEKKPEIEIVADMSPVSLETTDLSYRYDSQSAQVFSGLNLSVAPGESVAITGASGAGKTTLMKVLCGLFEPDSGKVLVYGTDIRKR